MNNFIGWAVLGLCLFGGGALGAAWELWMEERDRQRHAAEILVDDVASIVEKMIYG